MTGKGLSVKRTIIDHFIKFNKDKVSAELNDFIIYAVYTANISHEFKLENFNSNGFYTENSQKEWFKTVMLSFFSI